MLQLVQNKTAKIAIVDSSAANRQLISEIVKSFGFAQPQSMETVKEVVQFLETDTLDLVICALSANEEFNALSLLTLFTQNYRLRHIRVCLTISEEESYCLPSAYALGLVSHYFKPFTKDSLKQGFTQFINFVEMHHSNEALVAAEYLRPLFRKNKEINLWSDLEKKLLQLYPGSTDLLINFAEPLLLSGKKQEAANVLHQSILIDPRLEERANTLFKNHAGPNETLNASREATSFNALGINRVVIVDKDETIQTSLKEILNEIGVKDVVCFDDGAAAAKYIKENPDPELVIQEWRIPKLAGPVFVQRIAKEGASNSMIVVLSSLVTAKDVPLIKEMGVVNIIEKPFEKAEFIKALVWTLQQERMPTESASLEIKVRRLLRARKQREAEQLLARYLENPKVPETRKLIMQAEWDYANKNFVGVKAKCIQALKNSNDSVNSLSLLGKALMHLRDFDGALKCLEKAQQMSPQNIERLCQIAETQSEMGAEESSEKTLNEAVDLDPDAEVVNETKVKVAMNHNNVDQAKSIMNSLESLENLVGHMNNRAVALAKIDKVEDSIAQYDKAVASLPDSKPLLKSLILYNYALALVKLGKLADAKIKIEAALANPSNKIKTKAESLKSRIETALASGSRVQLRGHEDSEHTPIKASPQPNDAAEPISFVISEILPSPGEIGCYLIYSYTSQDPKIIDLLKKRFTFNERESIERAETFKTA